MSWKRLEIERTSSEKRSHNLAFFNLERLNSYKENKSPWQLAKEKDPGIKKEALILPPIDLDHALSKMIPGGNYVLIDP